MIGVPNIVFKTCFETCSTLTILPPELLGLVALHLHLDHIIFDNEQQRRVDLADVREVSEDHERHQHKLIPVGVLVVASLPVPHPRRKVLVINDQDVSDAPHPHVRSLPVGRTQVHSQRHLVLCKGSSGFAQHGIHYRLELRILRRYWLLVSNVELDSFMHLIAIPCGLSLLERIVLQDLDLVVPALAAFKIFEATV